MSFAWPRAFGERSNLNNSRDGKWWKYGNMEEDWLGGTFFWAESHSEEITHLSFSDIDAFQTQLLMIVDSKDHGDGVNAILEIMKQTSPISKDGVLARKAAERLQKLWKEGLRVEVKNSLAISLLRLVIGNEVNSIESNEALNVLRYSTLSSEIYQQFFEEVTPQHSPDNIKQAPKRRRSFGTTEQARIAPQVRDLTIVLELLENDRPERFPELLGPMFDILGKILTMSEKFALGTDYLIQVLLSCLINIIDGFKKQNPGRMLDDNSVRIDMIVNCLRSTSSPQLQNSALLLIAALADIAPDAVLHSVMPIFTFMGANILRQDDEYSVHVIEQTIQKVIPHLLRSFQTQSSNSSSGITDILSNFVAAFQHIPAHRRLKLFLSLSKSLNSNEYLFALLLLLGEKYQEEKTSNMTLAGAIYEFPQRFSDSFPASVQINVSNS